MKSRIFFIGFLFSALLNAQETEKTDTTTVELGTAEIIQKLPLTTDKINKKELNRRNLGQDMATLLGNETSVVTVTDGGNGIGYSSIRIRGVNQDHINISLNGVPMNDPESQNVFWVNTPDLASSLSSVVIQRGVGTSATGVASFGASIFVESEKPAETAYLEGANSYGSFNTRKFTLRGGTGAILDNKLRLDINASMIQSDGYIDRASSDLYSYGMNAKYELNQNTAFTYWNFNGNEKTYQAWNGIDAETLKTNRRFNPAGAIYDEEGNIIDFYENETDNYKQSHHHLSWIQRYGGGWNSSATLFFTTGQGYYENYKQDAKLYKYKIESEVEKADLIRQKWLDNHFYGLNLDFNNQRLGNFQYFGGIAVNFFQNQHFGKVIWVENRPDWNPDFEFYRNRSFKSDLAVYSKAVWILNDFEIFGDIQYRFVNYETRDVNGGNNEYEDFFPFKDVFHFVNPKIGLNYHLDKQQNLYFFYGLAHREPIRSDYLDNEIMPKPEKMHDFELGYKKAGRLRFNPNLFVMYYLDQLVATGELNQTGNFIRTNSGKSMRAGLEFNFDYQLLVSKLNLFGNLSYNLGRNFDYSEVEYLENGDEIIINHGNTQISFSPEWVGAAGVNYQPVKNLNLNLTSKYVSSQFLTNTERPDGKLDSYFLTDFLISYHSGWEKLKKLEFSFLVNNLFNVKYESNGFFFEQAFYYPQAGINVLGGVNFRF